MDDNAKAKRPDVDWERIEHLYRAGAYSLREIAREFGITEAAIRKRAKRDRWQRDIAQAAEIATENALVRDLVRSANQEPGALRTDAEIIAEVADTRASIVKLHRSAVRQQHGVVNTLFEQLGVTVGIRDTLEPLLDLEAQIQSEGAASLEQARAIYEKQLKALRAAVSIPSHAKAVLDLASASAKLVAIERQAFGLDQRSNGKPTGDDDLAQLTDEQITARLASRLAKFAHATGAGSAGGSGPVSGS